MEYAGAIIGIPFSLEGFAFFTEAIFLGVYLYGWNRLSAGAHMAAGVIVALSGAASAVFVVMVNAWMNAPTGITVTAGQITSFSALAGMRSPAALAQVLHMLLAAYAATGLAVAGIHALTILRQGRSPFHGHALAVALLVGAPAAILQPAAGDFEARIVARTQPVKLAALEGQFTTERGAPLRIGGWPDAATRQTRYAIEIPGGLSFMAYGDRAAEVRGLADFPREDWPPVLPVHLAFQLMVGFGTLMAVVSIWAWWRRGKVLEQRALLRALVFVAPLGFLATELGWVVTEVGRQPWVIQGLLRTADAVTPMPGIIIPSVLFTLLYFGLAGVVVFLIRTQVRETHGP
jgi:cytochrome d ubiquinol oxidase subunit I